MRGLGKVGQQDASAGQGVVARDAVIIGDDDKACSYPAFDVLGNLFTQITVEGSTSDMNVERSCEEASGATLNGAPLMRLAAVHRGARSRVPSRALPEAG